MLAEFIINRLDRFGFQAVKVGGCVRDTLLGIEPKDIDVATSATPDEVKNTLKSSPGLSVSVKEIGAKFGVLLVSVDGPAGESVEVATFRSDGVYSDNRRPDDVKYTTVLHEDLERRDFTINAMAIDINSNIFDCFGGREDIENGLIRAVGDPNKRFEEDALRILRGIRFAARFGFEIEKQTLCAMRSNVKLLKNIAIERIREELDQILMSANFKIGISYLFDLALYLDAFKMNRLDESFRVLDSSSDLDTRWALIIVHLTDSVAEIKNITKYLKFDNTMSGNVLNIIETADTLIFLEFDRISRAEKIRLFRRPMFTRATLIVSVFDRAGFVINKIHREYQKLIPYLNPQPFLTGDDLINLGLAPSPQFKKLLEEVETGQLNETIKIKEEALEYIKGAVKQ